MQDGLEALKLRASRPL